MRAALLTRLESIGNPTILVVGDLMLDLYIWGDVERISPEAPVQVVNVISEESRPGGASNVAAGLAALGANVICCGFVGKDPKGGTLRRILKKLKVDVSGVIEDSARPTTEKTRIIAHSQQLLRVDKENPNPIRKKLQSELFRSVTRFLPSCNAVLLSDYGKGSLPDCMIADILAACKKARTPVLVDPARRSNFGIYSGCTVLKPNRAEAAEAAGIEIVDARSLQSAAQKLLRTSRAENLIITQGGEGMTIFKKGADPVHVAGLSRPVFDVTGAGDTVLSLLGYVLAGGGTLEEAAEIANVAGGLAVGKIGAVPVTKNEIARELYDVFQAASHKLKTLDEIARACTGHRRRREKIVFTNGCFDLLHAGHIKLFRFAKSKGDLLIVGLNSDESVKRLKGPQRPVLDQDERACILSALEHVDYVVIFKESTPLKLIKRIRPDVLVKGADYANDIVVGREFVESYGGRVELAPLVEGLSSTGIMSRITGGERAASKR